MCGIVGIVDFDYDLLSQGAVLAAMLDTIAHRGPDAGGTFMTHQAAHWATGVSSSSTHPAAASR